MDPADAIDEIVCNCLAARVRVVARTVTAVYEAALRGHGLTIAQVNLLAALGKVGPCSPARLGEVLQPERSTVSRNLESLLKHRWAHATTSDGKGVRGVQLTALGKKKIGSLLRAHQSSNSRAE